MSISFSDIPGMVVITRLISSGVSHEVRCFWSEPDSGSDVVREGFVEGTKESEDRGDRHELLPQRHLYGGIAPRCCLKYRLLQSVSPQHPAARPQYGGDALVLLDTRPSSLNDGLTHISTYGEQAIRSCYHDSIHRIGFPGGRVEGLR